ncbi:MAG TPA: rhamnan synthesis F family protein [Roseiarcus sp.]|nr:rhamnan synthesis F family protein [Roseiarcus sp.]
MSTLPFSLGRAYRLTSLGVKGDDAISHLRIGCDPIRNVVLPHAKGLGYVVAPTGSKSLSINARDFRVERLGMLGSVWARLRLMFLFKKKKYLDFGEFALFSVGPKRERKRFTSFTQHMVSVGLAVDGDLFAKVPQLVDGWAHDEVPPESGSRGGGKRIAIVAHVFYEDTWPDIAGVIKSVTVPYDLIVTTVQGRMGLIERIRRSFPHAAVEIMENRGRDVRPFLVLLESGRLDRYSFVCKIHGKKSSDGDRKSFLGAIWRRRVLFDLLGAPGLAEAVIDRFERDPAIGMIGPRAFRMPSKNYSEALSWSANRDRVLALAAKLGISEEKFQLDFFGGTMFWVRPEALRPLRDLRLSSQFADERGLLDGGLEHAVERLFATSVIAAGYKLADCDGSEAADFAGPLAASASDG